MKTEWRLEGCGRQPREARNPLTPEEAEKDHLLVTPEGTWPHQHPDRGFLAPRTRRECVFIVSGPQTGGFYYASPRKPIQLPKAARPARRFLALTV